MKCFLCETNKAQYAIHRNRVTFVVCKECSDCKHDKLERKITIKISCIKKRGIHGL